MKTYNYLLLLLCLCFGNILQAQDKCSPNVGKRSMSLYQKALNIHDTRPQEAIAALEDALVFEPDFADAYFLLGDIYYEAARDCYYNTDKIRENRDYMNKAEQYYNKTIQLCESTERFLAYFLVGEIVYTNKQYEKAQINFNNFIEKNSTDTMLLIKTHQYLNRIETMFNVSNNPIPFNPQVVRALNTNDDEFLPLLSPDGTVLFFTRRFTRPNDRNYTELFMFADVTDTLGVFTAGKPMPSPFNDGRNQGGAAITIDNNHLFLTVCEFLRVPNTSYKNCDIYTSDFVNGQWTKLRKMGNNINGNNTFEGQPSITSDGNVMFFSSSRDGGFGGMDIYKVIRDSSGNWGNPQNLGPDINTRDDEKTPYIHTDSQTLYFASNGLPGIGGFDIYFSQYQGNGAWSEPRNIGYPINTKGDDLAYAVSANGENVYFAANAASSTRGWDIYSSVLHEEARPQKVLFVKGNLFDTDGNRLKDAHVELTSINKQVTTQGMVDKETGKYAIAMSIEPNEQYLLSASAPNTYYSIWHFDPAEGTIEVPVLLDLQIERIDTGVTYVIENVHFELNSYHLDETSEVSLKLLVRFMKNNPTVTIELHGHTDLIGTEADNQILSENRARAVYEFLVEHGIASQRMSYKGFGETRPIASNSSAAGRALNRRTEFVVLKK